MLKVGETDSLGEFTAKRTMTFNLKTGEALNEPADEPIETHEVILEDGQIYISSSEDNLE